MKNIEIIQEIHKNRKRERESKREREREKRERERGERERENLPETCGGPESASSSGEKKRPCSNCFNRFSLLYFNLQLFYCHPLLKH